MSSSGSSIFRATSQQAPTAARQAAQLAKAAACGCSRTCQSSGCKQVLSDIHTICSAEAARVVAPLTAVAPTQEGCASVLVCLQAHLIASAAKAGSQSDITVPGAPAGNSIQMSFGPPSSLQQQQQQGTASDVCSTGSSSSRFEPPQQLPAALAAFQGVALQTIASFDGCARSAARHIEAMQGATTSRVEEAARGITCLCFSADESRPGPLLALVQAAGPGSREQQGLYSCLRSIVKLASVCVGAAVENEQWQPQFLSVALAAVLLLAPPVAELVDRTRSAAAGGSSTQSPTPAATAAVYLPSLVLLGRAFQIWAQGLQCSVTVTVPPQLLLQLAISSMDLERLVKRVLDWLADSSVMQQLAAAGYGVQQLPAMLQGLLAAHAAARRSLDGNGCIETAAAGLQAELEAAAAALTALATTAFCNNPACQNVSGPTELSLVSGRSCLCGRCCVARYCSCACQRAHWAQHKPVCKALAAATAAAGAAVAAADAS